MGAQMRYPKFVLAVALAAAMAMASTSMVGQTPDDENAAPPGATAWGDPNLQGIWRGLTEVRLERAPQYQGR